MLATVRGRYRCCRSNGHVAGELLVLAKGLGPERQARATGLPIEVFYAALGSVFLFVGQADVILRTSFRAEYVERAAG